MNFFVKAKKTFGEKKRKQIAKGDMAELAMPSLTFITVLLRALSIAEDIVAKCHDACKSENLRFSKNLQSYAEKESNIKI